MFLSELCWLFHYLCGFGYFSPVIISITGGFQFFPVAFPVSVSSGLVYPLLSFWWLWLTLALLFQPGPHYTPFVPFTVFPLWELWLPFPFPFWGFVIRHRGWFSSTACFSFRFCSDWDSALHLPISGWLWFAGSITPHRCFQFLKNFLLSFPSPFWGFVSRLLRLRLNLLVFVRSATFVGAGL